MKARLIQSVSQHPLEADTRSVTHQEVQTGCASEEALQCIIPRPYRVCSMVFRRKELKEALREQDSLRSGYRVQQDQGAVAAASTLLETKHLPRLRQGQISHLIRQRSKSGLNTVTPTTSDHSLVPVQNFSFVSVTKKRRKKPFQRKRLILRHHDMAYKLRQYY